MRSSGQPFRRPPCSEEAKMAAAMLGTSPHPGSSFGVNRWYSSELGEAGKGSALEPCVPATDQVKTQNHLLLQCFWVQHENPVNRGVNYLAQRSSSLSEVSKIVLSQLDLLPWVSCFIPLCCCFGYRIRLCHPFRKITVGYICCSLFGLKWMTCTPKLLK